MDEHYVSPDSKLRLIILREQDDVTIGFEYEGVRTDWHTHPEVIDGERQLAGMSQLDYEATIQQLVDDVTSNRLPIVIVTKNGRVDSVSATYCIYDENLEDGETQTTRFWDGSHPA